MTITVDSESWQDTGTTLLFSVLFYVIYLRRNLHLLRPMYSCILTAFYY